jgi:uncharacterized membrane protein YphA (DoxX/SURF4 family)
MTDGARSRVLAVAALVGRGAAGLVLALSGYLKAVRPPEEMAAVLEGYWLLPASVIPAVARVVPWVELLAGLALLTGYLTRIAASTAGLLYAGFIVFLSQSMVRGLKLQDCGCFGSLGPHLTPVQSLTMDSVLLILCIVVIVDRGRLVSLDRWIDGESIDRSPRNT